MLKVSKLQVACDLTLVEVAGKCQFVAGDAKSKTVIPLEEKVEKYFYDRSRKEFPKKVQTLKEKIGIFDYTGSTLFYIGITSKYSYQNVLLKMNL